jgi:hypothetical protein
MDLNYYRSKLESDPTLFDLLAIRGYDNHDRDLLMQHINSGEIATGAVWENALTEFMSHTKKCSLNSMSMDFEDGTDCKFVMTSANIDQPTLTVSIGGVKNKTGTLRICICSRQDNYKLYFMLIPYSVYSKWPVNTNSPLKLCFTKSGKPLGSKWHEYGGFVVPFSMVSAPMSAIQFTR